MSETPKHPENLQHAAEHEKPSRRNPVLLYLVILFAAAFLLLLMSLMMQRRANQEAMNDLQQTSNSAVQSLENTIQENETLKSQVAELEEEKEALTQQAQAAQEEAQAAQDQLQAAEEYLAALEDLNTLRGLYNQGRYSDARDFLSSLPQSQPGVYDTETALSRYVTEYAQAQDLEVYNPLEAWQQLVEWLG